MADSDDDSDRRHGRDKFRRERSDFDSRRGRPGDKREPFDDRIGMTGGRQTDKRSSNELRGGDTSRSPPHEPPYKRQRRDMNDDHRYGGRRGDNRGGTALFDDESCFRPPLVPFKRFLEPLDDSITEEEACKRYKEYKGTYHKRHIEEFFEAHKHEEWLRLRYHPDHIEKRNEMIETNLKHRLDVFMDLFEKGYFTNQSVQMDNSENLIRLMDAVVIKLEGGSDADLETLDSTDRSRYRSDSVDDWQKDEKVDRVTKSSDGHRSEEGEAHSDIDGDGCDRGGTTKHREAGKRSRDSSASSAHSEVENGTKSIDKNDGDEIDRGSDADYLVDKPGTTVPIKVSTDDDRSTASSVENLDDEDDQDVPTPTTAEAPDGGATNEDELPVAQSAHTDPDQSVKSTGTPRFNGESAECDPDLGEVKRQGCSPWPLHKTASIFFRALPPTIEEAELNEICASQPGFLRLALWDPVPERRFMRHGWATYQPTVNIKKVCWALNNSSSAALGDKLTSGDSLGATVNRELAQRVRPLSPITRHKAVMLADLVLAARLVAMLDKKHHLWDPIGHDGEEPIEDKTDDPDLAEVGKQASDCQGQQSSLSLALGSKNPLLRNLTDYLVDERAGEEEALLAGINDHPDVDGASGSTNKRANPVVLESDPKLAQVLDHIILYLRVVHSVDFYAGAVYPMEDQMPHRCGILHARGDRGINPPSSLSGERWTGGLTFSQREIDGHIRMFASKLRLLIDVPTDLTDDEMKQFGMRDPEKVAEDFVEANIQKRTGKKKPFKVVWVCPLSDKKFREPIFVRKHIFNKHMDKVEAAKKDNALFFNNYLRDPRRPALPEAPLNNYGSTGFSGGGSGSYQRNPRGGRVPSFRGVPYRNLPLGGSNSLLPTGGGFNRGGSFQDYYDLAASQQNQHQHAMAAVAAAAAAALYPNSAAADIYAFAGPRGMRGSRGQRRDSSPSNGDYGDAGRRRQQGVSSYGGYGNNNDNNYRRPYRANDRSMVSYTDLDDPGNDFN